MDIRTEAGLTLVELLVAMLLAAILSAGLFYMMTGQSRAYSTQLTNLTTQENLWGAMEFVQRNIRSAGFGYAGCPNSQINQWDGGTSYAEAARFIPLRIYNGCNLYTDTNDPPCPTGTANAPDSFSVAYHSSTGGSPDANAVASVTQPVTTSSGDIVIDIHNGIQPGLAALWQPGSTKPCLAFEITAIDTSIPDGYKLVHSAGGSFNPPTTTDIFASFGGYEPEARVIDLRDIAVRHFAIDHDDSNPKKIPRLITWTTNATPPSSDTANYEVVADGVEDLQLSYACDDNTPPNVLVGRFEEGTTTATMQTDEWANNVATDTVPACTAGIGMVRITMTARTPSQDSVDTVSRREAAEDRPAGPLDSYVRRRLTVLVQPRNLRSSL